jgi:integrase/recombinase XerD
MQMEKFAKTAMIQDIRFKKKGGVYPVKLRITFDGKQKYFPTAHNMSKTEFEKVMYGKRLTEDEKNLKGKILAYESKATNIIEDLPFFDWVFFEKKYTSNRAVSEFIDAAYAQRIKELQDAGQVGTAVTYKNARESLNKFKSGLRFQEITLELLNKYEAWMLSEKVNSNGKMTKSNSKTTISMYLRTLRTFFNAGIEDKSIHPDLYPFSKKKNDKGYRIPTGNNFKKALTLEEIGKIYNYNAPEESTLQMARDFWLFMYLCNGMNMKDLCLLTRRNVNGDILQYERAKTAHSNGRPKIIRMALTEEAKTIIERWKARSGSYLFPVLKGKETPDQVWTAVQSLTRLVNKKMKLIAGELGITGDIGTYYARHSFATIQMQAGTSVAFISAALGHSSINTTQNYLAGFEDKSLKEASKHLTAFKKS